MCKSDFEFQYGFWILLLIFLSLKDLDWRKVLRTRQCYNYKEYGDLDLVDTFYGYPSCRTSGVDVSGVDVSAFQV